jgi:hypothetical protein
MKAYGILPFFGLLPTIVYLGVGVRLRVVADLVAHGRRAGHVEFVRHATRHRHGGDATRLRDANQTCARAGRGREEGRETDRLARTRVRRGATNDATGERRPSKQYRALTHSHPDGGRDARIRPRTETAAPVSSCPTRSRRTQCTRRARPPSP